MPGPLPIEVKYGKIDTAGLSAFMEKFKVKKGYLITPDKQATYNRDGNAIRIIPAYKFLLDMQN